ncbi:MAG: hypothetical protein QW559_01295 [Candidatus Woesearchaeota archaeon]
MSFSETYSDLLITLDSAKRFIELTEDPNKEVHTGPNAILPGFQTEFLAALLGYKFATKSITFPPYPKYSSQTTKFNHQLLPEKPFAARCIDISPKHDNDSSECIEKRIKVYLCQNERDCLESEIVYARWPRLDQKEARLDGIPLQSAVSKYYILKKKSIEGIKECISNNICKADEELTFVAYVISLSSNSIAEIARRTIKKDKGLTTFHFPVYAKHEIDVFPYLYILVPEEKIKITSEIVNSRKNIFVFKSVAYNASSGECLYRLNSIIMCKRFEV